MPNLTIIDPCDALDIEQAVPAIADHPGPVYMRLLRGNVPVVLDEYDYQFELGKAKLLRDGADVLLDLVRPHDDARARSGGDRSPRKAYRRGACCTRRPSSRSTRRRSCAKRAGRAPVVVAENHTRDRRARRGGRRPADAQRRPHRFRQIGLPDAFLDAGALPTLHDRYGLSAGEVAKTIRDWVR